MSRRGTPMPVVPCGLTLPKGVQADGFETLLERTGISPEEVLVFEMAQNDVEILSKVPHSVAVANEFQRSSSSKAPRWRIADDGKLRMLCLSWYAQQSRGDPLLMMEN